MDLSFEALDLKLHVPFTIARGTQHQAQNVCVTLSDGTMTGLGEAAPNEHYGEVRATVLASLNAFRPVLAAVHRIPISTLHRQMESVLRLNPAAKAAVDLAAHDPLGKRLG